MLKMKTLYKIFTVLSVLVGILFVITAIFTGAAPIVWSAIFLIFFGGAYYLWKLAEREENPDQHPKEPQNAGFCTQCGTPVQSNTRFCRNCGKERES